MPFNYIDVLIALFLVLFAVGTARRGVLVVGTDLATLVLSVLISLRLYMPASRLLMDHAGMPGAFARALGFLLVLIVAQVLLGLVARRLLRSVPPSWHETPHSQALGTLPAVAHGAILVGAVLLLVFAMPLSPTVKNDIERSQVGGAILDRAIVAERAFADIFGEAIQETLAFLTVPPSSPETIDIPQRTEGLEIDVAAEERMLELVNEERRRHGLQPLVIDETIIPVSRAHSRDMWERGYFSHVNPDGDDPFDRMRAGGVEFRAAAENLALAPTTATAHRGLMDSPGHRRNILDPTFSRIGIGVIDGGPHGKMFTQLFAD